MASVFTFLLMSCGQEEIKTTEISNHDSKYDKYYEILSFVEIMEGKTPSNPFILPRTNFTPSQLVMYIEGGMNLQYADPNLTWQSYENEYFSFTIPLSSGLASNVTVESLYEDIVDSASVHFYSIAESDRFPYFYDLAITAQYTSSLIVSVRSQVGLYHRDITPFGNTDYWYFWGGKCGPYSGQESIYPVNKLNDALVDYFSPYNCVFYTDLEAFTDDLYDYGWGDLNESDPTPQDYIVDYRTFKINCLTPDCPDFEELGLLCFEPYEMNYYFGSIAGIYSDFIHDIELNLVRSEMFNEVGVSNFTHYFWYPYATFGAPNSCLEGDIFPIYLPQCC